MLIGWIDSHPSDRTSGIGYAVLQIIATGAQVAWDGRSTRSLPNNWRDKVEFEPADSGKDLLSQPADLRAAIRTQAAAEEMSLSEWVAACCIANLPAEVQAQLSERPTVGKRAKLKDQDR